MLSWHPDFACRMQEHTHNMTLGDQLLVTIKFLSLTEESGRSYIEVEEQRHTAYVASFLGCVADVDAGHELNSSELRSRI